MTRAAADPTALLRSAEPADAPPPVLLDYQREWIADGAQLKVAEKGRRIGLTWAEAADDVLIASGAGGSNVFYISATQDMAREYIEACAMWARAVDVAAGAITEGLYADDGADSAARQIKTYEVSFPGSGRRIVALSSRPANLRGKQGVIVIDEAAFAPDLAGLLKAAMAMLMWGDRVRVISTHMGAASPFNELIQQIRAGKRGRATVHTIPFRRAIADGLYRRVCLRRGREWSQAAEDAWVAETYAFYGDDAAEELDVVPSASAGAFLSLALIEQRMVPWQPGALPAIVRGSWDDAFAMASEETRTRAIAAWIDEHLRPLVEQLDPQRRHALGGDFARVANLTSFTVLQIDTALRRTVALQVELFNCPFSTQQAVLHWLCDHLPRFAGGALDAGGMGAALAEGAAQRYGSQVIECVTLSETVYREGMPRLKAALEDDTLAGIPRDDLLRSDLYALRVINGVPKLPAGSSATGATARAAAAEGGGRVKRHGDFAISLFLAHRASLAEGGAIDWTPVPRSASTWRADGSGDGGARRLRMRADEVAEADDWAAVQAAMGGWE